MPKDSEQKTTVRINFATHILTLDGTPMHKSAQTEPGKEPEVATLGWICVEALLRPGPEKSGEEKYKLFALAMKIGEGGEIDLLPEDVVLLKKKIGDTFPPLVVGRAFDLLNR